MQHGFIFSNVQDWSKKLTKCLAKEAFKNVPRITCPAIYRPQWLRYNCPVWRFWQPSQIRRFLLKKQTDISPYGDESCRYPTETILFLGLWQHIKEYKPDTNQIQTGICRTLQSICQHEAKHDTRQMYYLYFGPC